MSESPLERRTCTVTIAGPFNAFELASLVAFIRHLDADHRHWSLVIDDRGGTTLEEAEKLLRGIVPEMPGRQTTFETHRKQ